MTPPRPITLHFVQDVPTPHNNVLLKALQASPELDLRIWYARMTHPQYSFDADLAHEVGRPLVYGYRWPSWRLIGSALFNPGHKFFVVGWMNPTTRVLVALFWLLRRPYNMWFDRPQEKSSNGLKNAVRELYYFLLKHSRANVFVVGIATLEYFRKRGFPEGRLVNLPIFVEVDKDIAEYRRRRSEIRAAYGAGDCDLFIVTGSRLIHEKGFDLLIDAIASLGALSRKVKLLIVGKGEEKDNLVRQAAESNLGASVFFEDWMDHKDFMAHVGAADLVVHPARYDAYGGITLSAMVAGVPVIGSDQAGSARDRIRHGVNGWLYRSSNSAELARWLAVAAGNRDMLQTMGSSARETAEMYKPDIGAARLLQGLL